MSPLLESRALRLGSEALGAGAGASAVLAAVEHGLSRWGNGTKPGDLLAELIMAGEIFAPSWHGSTRLGGVERHTSGRILIGPFAATSTT